VAQVRWWRDALRACRLTLPLVVAALALIGTVRLVAFMNAYAPGLSISESLSLARSVGRFDSLAAPFLVALAWLVVYPLLVGLRWATRRFRHRTARGRTDPRVRGTQVRASGLSSPIDGSRQRARRPQSAA
jgi:hypothetical protein